MISPLNHIELEHSSPMKNVRVFILFVLIFLKPSYCGAQVCDEVPEDWYCEVCQSSGDENSTISQAEQRDAIVMKNQADSPGYHTEKQLKKLGDKVPGPVKEKVEAKLKDLKDAISGGSIQAIKYAMAALNQEVMQLGQSLYSQAGADGACSAQGARAWSSDSSSETGPGGDVIEADFTDSKQENRDRVHCGFFSSFLKSSK